MRNLIFGVFSILLAASAVAQAEIQEGIVRQQWPWSSDVRVDYRLTGVTLPVDVKVRAYAGNVEIGEGTLASALRGEHYGVDRDGSHMLSFDASAAFPGVDFDPERFRLELSLEEWSAADAQIYYRIIDLTTFEEENVRRRAILEGRYGAYETDFSRIDSDAGKYWTGLSDVMIWTGVTNNPAYRTTKLVMRRIPAKDVTFEMGNIPGTYKPRDCNGYALVTLTNDYWFSVFEVTEAQIKLLTAVKGIPGTVPSSYGDSMPAGGLSYTFLRGTPTDWVGFPENIYAITPTCALQKMRDNLPGYIVDLPTEAQWEFAARAGTTNDLYVGYRIGANTSFITEVGKLAWYGDNSGGEFHEGGQLRPNAFGLYDVLGNQREQCRDLTINRQDPDPLEGELTEPIGLEDVTAVKNIQRGCYEGAAGKSNYCIVQLRGLTGGISGGCGLRLWMIDR